MEKQNNRHTDTQKNRYTDTQTHRHIDKETNRQKRSLYIFAVVRNMYKIFKIVYFGFALLVYNKIEMFIAVPILKCFRAKAD